MTRILIATGVGVALLTGALVWAETGRGGGYGEYDFRDRLRFGAVIQRDLEADESRSMHRGGLDSVRFWMSWAKAEEAPEDYDWNQADDTIREIAAGGLTPVPFLFGTPTWAAQFDGHECERSACQPFAPITQESRSAFARFAGAAVRRYGPGGFFWQHHPELPYQPIRVWQIWNEPNLQAFWRPYVDAIGYAELVRLAAEEIRAEDPQAEVVLGGLSGNRSTPTHWGTREYLERLYALDGITESFDGLAIHPYAAHTRGVLARIRKALAVAEVHHPGVDLWITEIGWASGGAKREGLVKTLKGQAKMLQRAFTRLIRRTESWRLRGLYWYAWRDTEVGKAVCAWCGRAGLRDRKGRPKPAFYALRRLAGT